MMFFSMAKVFSTAVICSLAINASNPIVACKGQVLQSPFI